MLLCPRAKSPRQSPVMRSGSNNTTASKDSSITRHPASRPRSAPASLPSGSLAVTPLTASASPVSEDDGYARKGNLGLKAKAGHVQDGVADTIPAKHAPTVPVSARRIVTRKKPAQKPHAVTDVTAVTAETDSGGVVGTSDSMQAPANASATPIIAATQHNSTSKVALPVSKKVGFTFAESAAQHTVRELSPATAAAAAIATATAAAVGRALGLTVARNPTRGRRLQSSVAGSAAEGQSSTTSSDAATADAATAAAAANAAFQNALAVESPFKIFSLQAFPDSPSPPPSNATGSYAATKHATPVLRAAVALPHRNDGLGKRLAAENTHYPDQASHYSCGTAAAAAEPPDSSLYSGQPLAAEQPFYSSWPDNTWRGSMCGDSEVTESEALDDLLCFNEGVQVTPPPLGDSVETTPGPQLRPLMEDPESLEQREYGQQYGLLGHDEREWLDSMKDGQPFDGLGDAADSQEAQLLDQPQQWPQPSETASAAPQHAAHYHGQLMLDDGTVWQPVSSGTTEEHADMQGPFWCGPEQDRQQPSATADHEQSEMWPASSPWHGHPDHRQHSVSSLVTAASETAHSSADPGVDLYGGAAQISLSDFGQEGWAFCLRRLKRQPRRHGSRFDVAAQETAGDVTDLHGAVMSGMQ